jgi:hypothetical protein
MGLVVLQWRPYDPGRYRYEYPPGCADCGLSAGDLVLVALLALVVIVPIVWAWRRAADDPDRRDRDPD